MSYVYFLYIDATKNYAQHCKMWSYRLPKFEAIRGVTLGILNCK